MTMTSFNDSNLLNSVMDDSVLQKRPSNGGAVNPRYTHTRPSAGGNIFNKERPSNTSNRDTVKIRKSVRPGQENVPVGRPSHRDDLNEASRILSRKMK